TFEFHAGRFFALFGLFVIFGALLVVLVVVQYGSTVEELPREVARELKSNAENPAHDALKGFLGHGSITAKPAFENSYAPDTSDPDRDWPTRR
ncbi:MAG TPA: hypothetical protein VII84_00005, partial [Acidimicrobiales bacterium]